MILKLDNSYKIKMPQEKNYNIYYGPNKIGKTQISYALKNYYENLNESVLLFNENILNDMIIQENDDPNSFEIMPMIQEYNKYKSEYENSKSKLLIKENLREICHSNTKKDFSDFKIILEYINEDVYSYKDKINAANYKKEELQDLFKSKSGLYNFFEIINILIKDNIKIVTDDIKSLVTYEIYIIQSKILEDLENIKSCPVCYSDISMESINKIRESVEKGSLEEKIKNSILYYMDSKHENIRYLIGNLLICNSCIEYKENLITEIQNSILYYLSDLYDIKIIDKYLNSKKQLENILDEIKNFKITETDEIYAYIKNKLKQHSVYKDLNIDIKINDGKLKVINSNIEYSQMSKSEQNFFKFLYFDILVHQKKQNSKLHVIVDDPFDSYDDIYIQDSIGIIVNLVNECINEIETIDIFSHSMYVIYLYENVESKFKLYWLDQINNLKEILVFCDNYELLSKIEKNPYDYGLILKISDKLVDKYSLITFAILLRNEINMERLLMRKNNENDTMCFCKKVNDLYDLISDSIDHIKTNVKIECILNKINEIFKFDLVDLNDETIVDVMNEVSSLNVDLEIKTKTTSGNIKMIDKNDICYILIYKVLLSLKIRRTFEEIVAKATNQSYKEIGELIPYLKDDSLKNFYNTYSYVLNAFAHSSSKLVPPVFVYSIKNLQMIYNELITL